MESDGLNMAHSGERLYIRCMRAVYMYELSDMSLIARNDLFKKDGKSRSISVGNDYVFITDFCDLYVLDKCDLHTVDIKHIGSDLSSDLCAVKSDANRAYISIRNGGMATYDLSTGAVREYTICDSSSWDFLVEGSRIYAGTVQGELICIDTESMSVLRKSKVCGKNIYSALYHNGAIYTVSQDMTLKAVSADTLDIIAERKRAVKGMVRILGVYEDSIYIADRGVSVWDKHTLEPRERIDIPTGHFNKGALLIGNTLYGSDFGCVYRQAL